MKTYYSHVYHFAYRSGLSFSGDWPIRSRHCDQIKKFPVQTALVPRLDLGKQPHYEVPGDLRTKIDGAQSL